MSLHAIWAQTPAGVIGADGTMPWRLPEDMRRFVELTRGHPVIMGRRTWESLPARSRPLPGRTNLVLSRDPSFVPDGATRLASLQEALAWGQRYDVWVMGGGEIYRALLPHCTTAHVTFIAADVSGDTQAPDVSQVMTMVTREPAQGCFTSTSGLDYWFTTWHAMARHTAAAGDAVRL